MSSERRLLLEALPSYDVGDEIGRGGWGVVLEASHRTLERQVAIKQLPRAFGADPDVRARFLAEARVVASLDHPHIVPLYDFVEHDGMCLLVMEYMPGGTLWDRFNKGGMTPEQCCAVAVAVLTALEHAHNQGVLHRDVKPENVLFNAAGVAKLADFGIAKVLGDGAGNRTATGVIMGTPAYMAPEQGSGQPVSPATDVYAVGAMLYELLAGKLPFESTGDPLAQLFRHVHEPPVSLSSIAPAVPEPLASAVMSALEKAPADRPTSAAAFARALDVGACSGFGDEWLERSGVPVLAARSTLGRAGEASPERSAGTVIIEGPVRPAPATPPPSVPSATPIPPPASLPTTPTPPAAPSGTLPPSDGPVGSPQRARVPMSVVLAGAVVLIVVLTVVAVLVLSGGDEAQEEAVDRVPTEAIERLGSACSDSGVPDAICTCAIDSALEELTVDEFMANDLLLQRDGDGLTEEMTAIFSACQDQQVG